MNYYNPYYNLYPMVITPSKVGIFSKLLGGSSLSFSSILNNAGKALNVANQAIPLIKQATPIVKNAKTMFKVMNEFKKVETPVNLDDNVTNTPAKSVETKEISNGIIESGPVFFA